MNRKVTQSNELNLVNDQVSSKVSIMNEKYYLLIAVN